MMWLRQRYAAAWATGVIYLYMGILAFVFALILAFCVPTAAPCPPVHVRPTSPTILYVYPAPAPPVVAYPYP